MKNNHKRNRGNKTIIYVNFAPYENAGRILDFVKEHFETVILFSFNFHTLAKNQAPSHIVVYTHNKKVFETRLYQTPTPQSLAFFLLPIRSLVILLQLGWHTIRLKKKYGPFDTFFTVNAFVAWCGNLLRSLGLVNRTIFWVWDYYPPTHDNAIVKWMRWMYWQFDKPASIGSDSVIFLNKRLETLRKRMNILPRNKIYKTIGIGTDPATTVPMKNKKTLSLVFLGVVKKSQGLDLVFDAFEKGTYGIRTTLDILGGGPDEEYYKNRARTSSLAVRFHGYIPDDADVSRILRRCHIGIATYLPDESNVSYYSDPSKIKRYLSCGLPVITTNVFDFSAEIEKAGAGIVIPYQPNAFIKGIKNIMKSYTGYAKHAGELARAYQYEKLYEKLFD